MGTSPFFLAVGTILKVLLYEARRGGPAPTAATTPHSSYQPIPATQTQPQTTPSLLDAPTTQETASELRRRLGKELYRIELDLQGGARIAGKPCDCLMKAKHLGGVEATAEELMSYEVRPVYSEVVSWLNDHENEFHPSEIAKRPPEYYHSLVPQVRAFRKAVMGTESPLSLLTPEQQQALKEATK